MKIKKNILTVALTMCYAYSSSQVILQWAKSMGTTGSDAGNSITLDASGNVYTTGFFYGTVDFDPGIGSFNLTSAGGADIFVSKLNASGNFVWAKAMGGIGHNYGNFIAVDVSGNVYTTGDFKGTADFDPSAGSFNLTSGGGEDIFISKLDSFGNFVWAKSMGAINGDYGYSIVVDTSSNVYTTGYFNGTVDFDPGAGSFNLTSAGMEDIFISKLNAFGNFVWAKSMGAANSDYGHSLTVDASSNVYTVGAFNGAVDFDPGAGSFNLTSAGGPGDIFISKLDASGNFVWAKAMGGISNDSGHSIALDTSGNVYTTGYFYGTADFNPGAGSYNLTSVAGGDIFISKLDAFGNFVWAKVMAGTGSDFGRSIVVDSFGNVYTAGYFDGTVDFDPGAGNFTLTTAGGFDIFISKLDTFGNFVWTKKMGGTTPDFGRAIAIDALGDVYTTGRFYGTVDFNPGVGNFNIVSAGDSDIFVHKLSQCIIPSAPSNSTPGANQTICYNTSTALIASGGGTLGWYSASTGGIYLGAGANYTTPTLTTTTTYYVQDSNTCAESPRTAITITIPTFNWSSTICAGNTLLMGSHSYTASGTYIDTLTAFNSCDSIVTTNLTVLPANSITQSLVVCAGHTITVGTHTHTTNGTYTDTLTAFNACDSIVITNLTVLPANAFTWSTGICAGQSISIGNHVYNTNGTYTDTLVAFNLCDSIVTTHLTINQLPVVTITPNGPTIFCTGGNVVLDAGSGFVNYLWSNGSTSQSIQLTSSENDSVMVTDINGCSATSSATVVSVAPLPVLVITDPSIMCSPNTIDISLSSVTFGSSTGTLSYWQDIVGTISLNSSYYTVIDTTGTYYIRLDASGCSDIKPITVTINNDCVWPGDANKDSLVNNYDLLPIGLYYSQVGSPRTNISNLWQAYLSTNWGTTQSNGSDIKHVDCNGDGLINNNDTLAININFSLTHAVVANNFNQERLPNPDIYIVTSSNSYNAGDWVNAEVWIGSSSIPVSNLYGIAFNVNYDASLVQLGTESLTYPNSWLGIPGNNAIKISKIDALATTAYGGITRVDHINANGYGKIAEFKFQAKTSITSTSVLHLSVSRYLANDSVGVPLLFNTLADSITINPLVTGTIETITISEITIAPNPFTLQTTITFNEEQKHGIIKIIDVLGKEIKTIPFTGKQLIIEKGSMQAGIYFLQVKTEQKVQSKKIIIQ